MLIENLGQGGRLNHLGVEVEHTDQVAQAIGRLQDEGMELLVEDQTTCCFVVQDKVWVNGPDGRTKLADTPRQVSARLIAGTHGKFSKRKSLLKEVFDLR